MHPNKQLEVIPGESPEGYIARLEAEVDRLNGLINTPELEDFIKAIQLEAAHQVERWGEAHDQGKTPEDWLWTLAYLATKATQAARYGDNEKYLHHIITAAALMVNWHRAALAGDQASPTTELRAADLHDDRCATKIAPAMGYACNCPLAALR